MVFCGISDYFEPFYLKSQKLLVRRNTSHSVLYCSLDIVLQRLCSTLFLETLSVKMNIQKPGKRTKVVRGNLCYEICYSCFRNFV